MIIARSFEGSLLSHLTVHHVMGKVLHASKPSRNDVNPLPSSYRAQDSLPVPLRVRGISQAAATGAPVNPALDAASWGSQKHLCEPCHKNSGSPWKSLEMNSRIVRKGRILTSWSWVTAEKGQRRLKHNTAVGAGATVPESVLGITLYTAPCPAHPTNLSPVAAPFCGPGQPRGQGCRHLCSLLRDMLGHLLAEVFWLWWAFTTVLLLWDQSDHADGCFPAGGCSLDHLGSVHSGSVQQQLWRGCQILCIGNSVFRWTPYFLAVYGCITCIFIYSVFMLLKCSIL